MSGPVIVAIAVCSLFAVAFIAEKVAVVRIAKHTGKTHKEEAGVEFRLGERDREEGQ